MPYKVINSVYTHFMYREGGMESFLVWRGWIGRKILLKTVLDSILSNVASLSYFSMLNLVVCEVSRGIFLDL